jgi:hypothetical protein
MRRKKLLFSKLMPVCCFSAHHIRDLRRSEATACLVGNIKMYIPDDNELFETVMDLTYAYRRKRTSKWQPRDSPHIAHMKDRR